MNVNPDIMNKRIPFAKRLTEKAYTNFKIRFEFVTTNDTYLRCIRKFFEVAESKSYDDFPDEIKADIECSQMRLKDTCWELCMEAINRDFVTYLSTGEFGNVGKDVYGALKE